MTFDTAAGTWDAVGVLQERCFDMLKNSNNQSELHVRCKAHVTNLAVKECFKVIHAKVETVSGLIAAIGSLVKFLDQFEKVKL